MATHFSEAERQVLTALGYDPHGEDILMRVRVDMDPSATFREGSLLLSEKELILVYDQKDGVSRYALSDYEGIAVDEMLSSCRLYGIKEGVRELITYTTFFAKDDLYRLSVAFGKLKRFSKTCPDAIWIDDDIRIHNHRTELHTVLAGKKGKEAVKLGIWQI